MSNYFNGKGTIGFTCDICGRELNSCSIVNGMKFCAKCYQETFGKDNQQNEIQQLKQQLAEKDKEIEDLKEWQEWYSMWHKKFQKEIEDLKIELETYRPTKLHGNGQCECFKCKQEGMQARHWTDWCSEYKGHIYCDDCLKEVLKEEQTSQTQLAIQELEKVKDTLKHFCDIHSDEYYGVKAEIKGLELDVCESIDYQIKELKGE